MEQIAEQKGSKRILSFFLEEIKQLEKQIQKDELTVSDYIVKMNQTKE